MKKHIIILIVLAFTANIFAQVKINSAAAPITLRVDSMSAGFTGSSLYNNVSFGYGALNQQTGYDNTAVGYQALFSNTTGRANVATGYNALYKNTTGNNNTAVGYQALYDNTGGYGNVAVGHYALYYNRSGSYNTASGVNALFNNDEGDYNTANGYGALSENFSGSDNTAVGDYALRTNWSGSGNTAVGDCALYYNETGFNNIAIGNNADVDDYSVGNAIVIGCDMAAGSNSVRLGNYTATSAGGAVSWTTVSDGRAKRNIAANIPGLEFINRLQPVSYNLDLKAIDELTKSDDPKINAHRDSLQKAMSPEERRITEEARANKESKVYSGFIAQDVEKAAKESGYDFSGVDAPENGKGPYGLRYAEFVVPLVKAVQELSKQNDAKDIAIASLQEQSKSKDEAIANLQEQNNNLQKQINELAGKANTPEAVKSAVPTALPETVTGNASLEQNIPNPFNLNTVIKYYLPQTVTTAQLCIYDLNGKQLKQIPLSGRGEGSQTVQGSQFSPGIYLYTLIADGQEVDVKRMILTE